MKLYIIPCESQGCKRYQASYGNTEYPSKRADLSMSGSLPCFWPTRNRLLPGLVQSPPRISVALKMPLLVIGVFIPLRPRSPSRRL
jgi:hypothetical protein